MHTIGLLGGLSWESSALYYRIINELVRDRLGGLHSARIFMDSVDFDPVQRLQHEGQWEEIGELLVPHARRIEAAGADFLVICCNTIHKVAPVIEDAIGIPLLHIADATGQAIRAAGLCTVGLLATRFTMEGEFLTGPLAAKHGLNVLMPDDDGRQSVHDVIYDELCRGIVRDASRESLLEIADELTARGAEGIILGCTELSMILTAEHSPARLFDTMDIHARASAEYALKNE